MASDTETARVRLAEAVHTAAREVEARYEGNDGLRTLLARAQRMKGPRHVPRRTVWIAVGALAVAGFGGAAVAQEIARDRTSDHFRGLHPEKEDIDKTSVEPHTTVGTITLRRGVRVRLNVTTAPGPRYCANVQQLEPNGHEIGSVSYCGEQTSASLQPVMEGLVGWVPAEGVTSVKVSGPGGSAEARVSQRFFLIAPEFGPAGEQISVSGYDEAGRQLGSWTVTVPN